jgi:2-polyprenyl-3-methyl-5-hydroxy-6-metoxy-1,4-benzoquinol methylase
MRSQWAGGAHDTRAGPERRSVTQERLILVTEVVSQQEDSLDQAAVEAFADQMVQFANGFSFTLMTSIGHQTGLFDAMDEMPPSTSAEIATVASLNERYVREWLGAMVSGGIVIFEPTTQTYQLPPEHAASLTRTAGPGNIGVMAAELVSMSEVEQQIVACFRQGGGVPYSSYPRFQQLMAEDSGQVMDRSLISVTLPLIPDMIARLDDGIDVLDVGCGSGHAINLMAEAFPSSRFSGYDFSAEGIAAARAEADARGLKNAQFEEMDVATMREVAQFDLSTSFDVIHDQAHPALVLRAIRAALRPGGAYLMAEPAASSRLENNLDRPLAPMIYTISTMHCMTVSLAQGGDGLGTAWGEEVALKMLGDAGFSRIETTQVPDDVFNTYFIATL